VPKWGPERDAKHQPTKASAAEADRTEKPAGSDGALRALAEQLDALLAELAAVQGLGDGLNIDALRRGPRPEGTATEGCDKGTGQIEALLARLYPIELAIMATPARTITDLGVKARHAAYVTSEQWDAPINQLDWHARTVRLLIEAICNFADTSLPFESGAGEAVRQSRPLPVRGP
jgi:hypothetical protein